MRTRKLIETFKAFLEENKSDNSHSILESMEIIEPNDSIDKIKQSIDYDWYVQNVGPAYAEFMIREIQRYQKFEFSVQPNDAYDFHIWNEYIEFDEYYSYTEEEGLIIDTRNINIEGYKWTGSILNTTVPMDYINKVNSIEELLKDRFNDVGYNGEEVNESVNEEEITLPRYSVIGMNLKRNEKEGIGIVWDKDFDDPREAMKFAQEKGKEEPQHVVELIDTVTDKILYNSQSKNESLNDEYPPTSFEFDVKVDSLEELNDDEFIFELLTDLISDEYGYCHYGFNAEVIERDEENLIAKCEVSNVKWDLSDDEDDEFLSEALNEGKQFYLGWRGNPQLAKGGYYKAYGQLSKKEAKDKEKCVYGSMTLTAYDSEDEYNKAIEKAKNDGFRVN